MKTFDIYYCDLNAPIREELLKAFGIELTPKEIQKAIVDMKWDTTPLFSIPIPEK